MSEPMPGAGSEGVHFAGYLEWMRDELIVGVLRLSPEEQRTTRLASGWTPIELLSHVAHMEQRWLIWRFLGEDIADPRGDWQNGVAGEGSRWEVAAGVTAEDLALRLRAIGRRVSEIFATTPLETRAASLHDIEEDVPLDLRWLGFHVLTEYARHAGHLDIVVELAESST
jgi:uncharacterized damage-inducible protein DinB